mgnify:CR=1 FL=1
MTRVVLVDDHVLIRKGIGLLLGQYTDVEVVGEASDGAEAIQLAHTLMPDCIFMDVSIPNGLDGFSAAAEIKKTFPEMKVIMLTMHNEIGYIKRAIDVKADGYILKNSQGNEMYEAIQQVMRGQTYYDVGLPKEQLDKLFSQKSSRTKELLSTREQEIVRLTILGFTNQEIASQLFISVKTVENHKSNIMQKLELKSKAELVQYGLTNGYIN